MLQCYSFLCFNSCTNGRTQPSCYTCDTNEYCANGQCSINPATHLPECRLAVYSSIVIISEYEFITAEMRNSFSSLVVCRCSPGWAGYRCESVANSGGAASSGGRKSALLQRHQFLEFHMIRLSVYHSYIYVSVCVGTASIVIPVLLLLLLFVLAGGALVWYRRRMRG